MKITHLIATLGLGAALVVSSAALAAPKDKKVNSGPTTTADDKTSSKQASPKTGDDKKKVEGEKKSAKVKVGDAAPAFTLKDTGGNNVSLSDFSGKVVVLEWMNPGCPVCRKKVESGGVAKMMSASKELNKDVVFLFINSTAATAGNPSESKDYLANNKIEATALIDGDGTVGHAYNARTTPHVFVINDKGVLVYDGAIDDNKDGGTNYVVNAVKALKEGKAVAPETTTPYGCSVKYAAKKSA